MCGRPRGISRQKFPKRTRILAIPSKPYSIHSAHSAVGSRMNRMIFRSLRKRNRSQKNTDTVYSEYSYSGIVAKERPLRLGIIVHNLSKGFLLLIISHSFVSFNSLGSRPSLMMALFLMCVACLAGTALMALKKSRDKPDGYTVLATGVNE